MRLSIKLFLHTIFLLILWLAHGTVTAATITSINDGNWAQSDTWNGSTIPLPGDDAVINSIVTVPLGETVEINKITINATGKLVVYGTLIAGGDFLMNFDGNNESEFVMGPQSVVIVKKNVDLSNKVSLNLSSYFIVLGNLLKQGSTKEEDIVINNASIYVLGTLDSKTGLSTCSEYDGVTEDKQETCHVGNTDAFENNANNGTIPDAIVELVDNNNCCGNSAYKSRNAYTGDWKDVNSWSTPNESWRPLPPPNDPVISQSLCIKGYITLDDNLTIGTADQIICDTLVVTGNLYMTSNSFVVAPGGVLIVLGDFTAGSGSLVNNEGGKIIFAGEFTKTYSYSFSGTGDTYVFDPDPVSEGFTPTGNENDLEANDPSLFNFYISLVGGVPPTANCEDLTIYLDASGLASIQPADVHDGALMANLTYALSQSDFDCDDLGENTITLTATNSGGLSDDCTATVTVVDNLKPVVTCPPDSIASCIETISQPATTVAGFVARGGTISDNCAVNISAVDVTDKKDAINPCEVVRTYTITDQAGNVQTCVRKFEITDATAPVIQDCPNDITDSADENCEKVISVDAPTNFTDDCGFGDVTVYHAYTIAGVLIEAAGGIDQVAFPKGTTIITWSFEDECGNMGTCEQAITIKDDTEPTASCPAGQELDAGNTCSVLLPDYTSLLIDLNDNCDLNPTVTQRPAVDTEVFANTEIWLLYADEDGNQDSCSFLVNLTNLAPIDISEMLYDGGQSGIGAIGSGQKPFITSTHPYEIDQNESTPEDYTYTWLVLDQSGTEVTPDISSPDSNPQNAVIAFSETHFTEGDSYTIRVVKEQKTGNCSAVFELDIEVQQTNFNSGVQPLAPTCQDGGTGVPTVVFWDVDFTGGVEPYAFDFTISNGTEGCTGQVSNLFTNDLEPIEATENCNGAYTVAVTKESGMPAVQIAFTFISEAGIDKVFELTVDSATDQFSITKQTINTDERDDITLWGVPNTSDIETD